MLLDFYTYLNFYLINNQYQIYYTHFEQKVNRKLHVNEVYDVYGEVYLTVIRTISSFIISTYFFHFLYSTSVIVF